MIDVSLILVMWIYLMFSNHISGVMVRHAHLVFGRSWVGSSPDRVKPKTIILVFVASLLSIQH
jgi:hypothetical protein